MNTEIQVSYRQFAEMVGQTEGAVRKAVSRNSIEKGVIGKGTKSPKIIPSIACKEWGKPIIEKTTEPERLPEISDDLVEFDIEEKDEEYDEEKKLDDKLRQLIPESTEKSEADRLISVYKARKARLDYLRLEDQLVDRGIVFSTLFEFSQGIRDNLMNIPDRVIDNVLACENRNAAIILLGNEIAEVLDALSDLMKIELKND